MTGSTLRHNERGWFYFLFTKFDKLNCQRKEESENVNKKYNPEKLLSLLSFLNIRSLGEEHLHPPPLDIWFTFPPSHMEGSFFTYRLPVFIILACLPRSSFLCTANTNTWFDERTTSSHDVIKSTNFRHTFKCDSINSRSWAIPFSPIYRSGLSQSLLLLLFRGRLHKHPFGISIQLPTTQQAKPRMSEHCTNVNAAVICRSVSLIGKDVLPMKLVGVVLNVTMVVVTTKKKVTTMMLTDVRIKIESQS